MRWNDFSLPFGLLFIAALPARAAIFEDKSEQFGLAGGNEACWFDFNNDGWLDLYATAGFISQERGKPDG